MKSTIILTVCAAVLIFVTAGCDVPYRHPVQPSAFTGDLPRLQRNVLLVFDETIPGKPLNETVWDNVSGPMWDVQESKQIGFTQHYQPLTPTVIVLSSRIIVPFGQIFSTTLASAVENSSVRHHVAFSQKEAESILRGDPPDVRITVTVETFSLWEGPLNHLNLSVKGRYEVRDAKGVANYTFEKSSLRNKLGNVWNTDSHMVSEMNKISNDFADQLTAEIVKNSGL